MKYWVIFMAFFSMTFAQDTLDFWPVKVGNMWQYEDDEGGITNKWLLVDSVDTEGNHFITLGMEFPQYYPGTISYKRYYKIDTLRNVWFWDDYWILLYKLDAKIGDWWCSDTSKWSRSFTFLADTGVGYNFGRERIWRKYEVYWCDPKYNCDCPPDSMDTSWGWHILTEGIGYTYSWIEFGEEWLRGAIIDSVIYGNIWIDAIDDEGRLLPHAFHFYPAFPNPFNPVTSVRYRLPAASRVNIAVYDNLGRQMETLYNGFQPAGEHRTVWDAAGYASGVYFIRLKTKKYVKTQRVVLTR